MCVLEWLRIGLSLRPSANSERGIKSIVTYKMVRSWNDADQASSGVLTLYDPSSTTYVKHFTSVGNTACITSNTVKLRLRIAGYINTTSAIDEISFKFDSGNIDAGEIHMYGVG